MTTAPDDGKQTPRLHIVEGWQSLMPAPTPGPTTTPRTLNRTQKTLVGIVASGVVLIAGIGFAGSYRAVAHLATKKDFGQFAQVFPIGIDAGIVVFLALDLLLTWLRMPYPLLRPAAWALTGATIAFNAATAWPDALGVGMHAATPALFVVAVEAARHATGRVADLTADKHTENPPLMRWLLAPFATFRIWRRMRLWSIRSYEAVITIERDAAIYRENLKARYGRRWRSKAPVASLMPLRLIRMGTPVGDTVARQEAELAAATCRQNDRQEHRQNADTTAAPVDNSARQLSATGDSTHRHLATEARHLATPGGDNSTDMSTDNSRHLATTSAASTSDKSTDKSTATSGNKRQKPTTGAAKKTDRKTAKKADSDPAPRRSTAEWVAVASPVFDALRAELGALPTASQFATALAANGLGTVSESTAKNVRTYVLSAPAK